MEIWTNRELPHVEVEAVRLTEDNAAQVAAWCGAEVVQEINPEHPEETQPGLNVSASTGTERASLGMYVIKYGGSFFALHNRRFEIKYQPKERPAPPQESAGDSRKARGLADPFDQGKVGS